MRIADSISARLEADKHKTFFDLTNLPAGDGYDRKIRDAISKADLFLFLISPQSVEERSYSLTELSLARARWPDASGRVLSVMIEPTPMDKIPAYATAGTFLQTPGNLEADILATVAKISAQRSRRRLKWIAGTSVAMAIAAVLVALIPSPHADTVCYLTAELRRDDASTLPTGLMLDVRYAETTRSFLVSDTSAAIDVGPIKKGQPLWKLGLRAPDGSVLGESTLNGCITGEQGIRIGDVYSLILHPRT